jgi:hypothetical protein
VRAAAKAARANRVDECTQLCNDAAAIIAARRHYGDAPSGNVDPRFVLFEFTSGFLLREPQV